MIELRTFIVPVETLMMVPLKDEAAPMPELFHLVRFGLLYNSETDVYSDPEMGTEFASERVHRRPGEVYELMMTKRAEHGAL